MYHDKNFHGKRYAHAAPHWHEDDIDPMFMLQFVAREYTRCLQRRLHRQDENCQHRGRAFPLFVLMEEGKPVQRDQKEIAALLGVSPSTMTGALKRLEQSGLIEKHQDPADQRRKLIALTDKGLDFIHSRHQLHDDLTAAIMADLSEDERVAFGQSLTKIYRQLQTLADEQGE